MWQRYPLAGEVVSAKAKAPVFAEIVHRFGARNRTLDETKCHEAFRPRPGRAQSETKALRPRAESLAR
jgi:hypothetical protein